MRSLLLALLLVAASCSSTLCDRRPSDVLVGAPLACNTVNGVACCAWSLDGCVLLFCESPFACSWDYRGGTSRDGRPCEVPDGFVLLEVTRPPASRRLAPPRPTMHNGAI